MTQLERKPTSDNSVVRSTGSMAVATLMSRITGFIRTVMITSALGGAVASAFNTANTLPNMITEIVLGSVLTALVVPVLVRAEKEDPDQGAAFIRRLFTLTLTLVTVVTVVTVIAAPLLTRVMLDVDGEVNVIQSTSFAYLLLPQIMFYGLFSLFMAVLNTKEVFRPGAWAPVVNNLVSIAVLALYMLLPGSIGKDDPTGVMDPHVLLLGLGTTLGVVVQCLIMVPALRRLNIDLRPLWGLDDRLKQFGGMAVAIVTYVAISQIGYIINNRIASEAYSSAPAIYMQHWLLLQVPYGIIGVTLLTAIMPRLSRNAADGDDAAVVRDLTLGTKLTFIALIPIIIFMTALGPDIGVALFHYGQFTETDARTLGMTLSFSAFTLIPYALVMLHLRVFYAREEAWTPTFIIAGITVTKVVLAMLAPTVAASPEQVVVLLGAANGFGFVAGAIVGAFLLHRKLGNLGARAVLHTTVWAAAAGLVGIAAALVVRYLLRILPPLIPGSVGLLMQVAVLGIIFVIVTGIVLSFSDLAEVRSLGAALARIPGLNKIIRTTPADTVAAKQVPVQFLIDDTFNASPIPPPMSAGVVRGPRLVPGAAVSDGRFRLLRDHGSAGNARFWQATELLTGRMVALTFVDTCGAAPLAPVTPRQAALDAAGVAHRTRQIAQLNLPAVAPIIDIISYRTGCVVVAEWIAGSSLQAVAESTTPLLEEAVHEAMVPLTESMEYAHEQGLALGLDNRNRMRVTESGVVVLAFPTVLANASAEADDAAWDSARELLMSATQPDADLEDGLEEGPAAPQPAPETTPQPARVAGFGARDVGTAGTTALVSIAIVAVVAVAALTVYVVSHFSSNPDAPVTKDSVEQAEQLEKEEKDSGDTVRLPVIISSVATNSTFAPLTDGDTATTATVEPGDRIVLTAVERAGSTSFTPRSIILDSQTGGVDYTVFALPSGASATDPDLPVIANGTLPEERFTITVAEQAQQGELKDLSGVVVAIKAPTQERDWDGKPAVMRDITIVGTRTR